MSSERVKVLAGSSSRVAKPQESSAGKVEVKKEEKKDSEDFVDVKHVDAYPDGVQRMLSSASSAERMVLHQIVARTGNGGSRSANAKYRFLITDSIDVKTDGSGNAAGSLRFGDPTLWNGVTWSSLFQRFRVVHVEYTLVHLIASAGGVFGCYLDTEANSVTLSSAASAWAAPNFRWIGMSSTNYALTKRIPPVLKSKVKPESLWFDTTSTGGTQRGCFAYFSYGGTASVNNYSIYARYTVELSGLLV
jgi:hypothetical protein